MPIYTRRFTSRLPATPCTEEMRNSVTSLAETLGINVAELQRRVLYIFLSGDAKLFDNWRQEISQMQDESLSNSPQ